MSPSRPKPRPVEQAGFSYRLADGSSTGASLTPGPGPRLWLRLHQELANTQLAREQFMLRKEMHARFNL